MEIRNYICVSILSILLFYQLELLAQCPVSSVVLNTQAEVDAFATDYPNCTELNGSLRIEGADITNLDALSNLEALYGGALIMGNPILSDLNGLNSIEEITGLALLDNPSLVNFEGLNQLNKISGGLQIEINSGLEDFSGLEQLDTITGQLFIYNNNNVNDISALSNLEHIGGNLIITLSPLLSFCSIDAICDYLENPNGTFIFSANGTGCNSQQEIEDNCGNCDVDNVWQGPSGGSWHNANHWSLSEIPTDCQHVIIPSGSNLKVLSGMTANAFTLFVHDNAVFETEPASILNVMIE